MKSKKQMLLAAVAAVVIMVFAWYQVVWTGQTKSIAKADAAKAASAAQAKQVGSRAALLETAKADTWRAKLLEKLDVAVPEEPGLSAYLRWINDLADSTHVVVPTVGHSVPAPATGGDAAAAPVAPTAVAPGGATATPAAPAAPGSLYQMGLTMQATGTYENVLEFVHQLELSPRLVIVDSLGLSGGGGAAAAGSAPAAADGTGSATASTTTVAPTYTAAITARMFSLKGLDSTPTTGPSTGASS